MCLLGSWARESWLLCFSLISGMRAVCRDLFAHPTGIIGRLWSVIVSLPKHPLYYFVVDKLYLRFLFV